LNAPARQPGVLGIVASGIVADHGFMHVPHTGPGGAVTPATQGPDRCR
jgi:hypothetical protein